MKQRRSSSFRGGKEIRSSTRKYVRPQRPDRDLRRCLAVLEVKNRHLEALIHRLETLVRTDDLTGLWNRRWLNEMLQRAWAEAVRNDRPLAFMMIDLDGFKATNDTIGHLGGDEVLRRTGRLIQANCRQVDVPARYGGDEFCVLMPETNAHEAVRVAERILREHDCANRAAPTGEPRLGISIGISHIDLSRPVNAEQLIRHADQAMYAAKSALNQRIMLRGTAGVFASPSADRRLTPHCTSSG